MVTGKALKYGNNIDTDVIIPARYLNAPSPAPVTSMPPPLQSWQSTAWRILTRILPDSLIRVTS